MVWKIISITSIVSEKSDSSESLHKIFHFLNFSNKIYISEFCELQCTSKTPTSYRRDFAGFKVVETCDHSLFDFLGNSEDPLEILHQKQDQDSSEFVSHHFVLYDTVSECVQDQCLIVNLQQ